MSEDTKAQGALSRRQFGTVAGVAAVAAGTPGMALAAGGDIGEITERAVALPTANGSVEGFFVHPAKGTHPAVLSWRGGSGLNVTSRTEARRLAKHGYSVLVLDRDAGDAAPIETDVTGATAWLEAQDNVDEKRVGTAEWAKVRIAQARRY